MKYFVLRRILIGLSALAIWGCAEKKSSEWQAFYRDCKSETSKGGEFFVEGEPIVWSKFPYVEALVEICLAKANLWAEGLPIATAITSPELRIFIASEIYEKPFEQELRRTFRRD